MPLRELSRAEYAANLAGLAVAFAAYRRREGWSAERMQDWQLVRIRRLVEHAYRRVPLYRDKYSAIGFLPGDLHSWDDFRRLPTVTKAELVEGFPDSSVARGVRLKSCLISTSSGSTGRMMEIPHRAGRLWPYLLATHRLFRWIAGRYPPAWRQAYIYTSRYPVRPIPGVYPLVFIPTAAEPERMMAALQSCRPQLLAVYPSILRELLVTGSQVLRTLRLRAVSVNSELSTQDERDAWSAALGCPVGDDYSSEELTRIAAQCGDRRYHLLEDITLTEILEPASDHATDGIGEVVGTELHNTAMPFIRYRQGDLARLEPDRCTCGRPQRILSALVGRANDGFVLANGRLLPAGFLIDACYRALMNHPGVAAAYRLRQTSPDAAVLEVQPGPRYELAAGGLLVRALQAEVGSFLSISLATTPDLPRDSSGKRRTIVGMGSQIGRAV